jgi:hypothetical protein
MGRGQQCQWTCSVTVKNEGRFSDKMNGCFRKISLVSVCKMNEKGEQRPEGEYSQQESAVWLVHLSKGLDLSSDSTTMTLIPAT